MKIKIAHILHSVGGVDVSLRLILSNINTAHFENIVIHSKKDTSIIYLDKDKNVVKDYKTSIYRNINLFKDALAVYETYQILKKEKPNLIHAHSAKGGIIGRFLGYVFKINVLYTPQAFSYLSATKTYKKKIYLLIEKLFTNQYSYLLASSTSEKNRAINDNIFEENKTIIFNNSINPIEKIHPLKLEKTWPDQYICTVGRPSYQKNINLMIKIIYEIKKKQEIHLVLMGVGYHANELENVTNLIRKLNLTSNVTLLNWTTREDVFHIISNSVLYISTARYEGLPYSIIESLALSKPCIVTDCDGNKDLIKNNYNGYIIRNENVEKFKEKIIYLLNDKEKLQNFSKNAFQSYIDNYNIENNIKNLEDIYKSHI